MRGYVLLECARREQAERIRQAENDRRAKDALRARRQSSALMSALRALTGR